MPHVRRAVLVTIDAPIEAVRDALSSETGSSASTGPFPAVPFADTTLTTSVEPRDVSSTRLALDVRGHYDVPFFRWFVELQAWLSARPELPELYESIGLGIRQRLQENAIDHGVDRGTSADPEGQRENGDGREGRCAPQEPKCVLELSQ